MARIEVFQSGGGRLEFTSAWDMVRDFTNLVSMKVANEKKYVQQKVVKSKKRKKILFFYDK